MGDPQEQGKEVKQPKEKKTKKTGKQAALDAVQKAEEAVAAVSGKPAATSTAVATAAPPKEQPKAELIKPFKTEITFKNIVGLKVPLTMDDKGSLICGFQFQAKIDQYELFRLINLMNQPNGGINVTFSSNQASFDFKFDPKEKTFAVISTTSPLPADTIKTKIEKETKAAEEPKKVVAAASSNIVFEGVSFNHVETEKEPFGVAIDFSSDKGAGVGHILGRGKTACDAVFAGLKQIKLFEAVDQPFKFLELIKTTKETPAQVKLVRTIEMGKFFEGDGKGQADSTSKSK